MPPRASGSSRIKAKLRVSRGASCHSSGGDTFASSRVNCRGIGCQAIGKWSRAAWSASKHIHRLTIKQPAQLDFCLIEDTSALGREASAAAIDVEIEHRHRRLEWRGFASVTREGRALERDGDLLRGSLSEDAVLQVKRITSAHDLRGPFPLPRRSSRLPGRSGSSLCCHFKPTCSSPQCSTRISRTVLAAASERRTTRRACR